MSMKRQEYKMSMVEIDLKKLGALPYCEMNARATIRPEHDGFIEIIIPICEQDGVRVLKEIELKRELKWSSQEDMKQAIQYCENKEQKGERKHA